MKFKNFTTILGRIIVFVSFLFLGFLLYKFDFSSIINRVELFWFPTIVLLSFIFSFLYIFLACGWKKLLEISQNRLLDMGVISVYLKTVIFKYAPGNVFHFLGRHSLVKSHGLSNRAIVFANGAEIILQLISVGIIIFIGLIFFGVEIDFGYYFGLSFNTIIMAFALFIFLISIIVSQKKYRDQLFSYEILSVIVLQTFFLVGSSSILIFIYVIFFDVNISFGLFGNMILISSIAWLLGFIVPGAPGGIGIRESTLLLLLPSVLFLSKEELLAGAIIFRLVTILGEVFTFFLAKLVIPIKE
jgi:uncharacterized membrane protein YbhN (UPF0104 family)